MTDRRAAAASEAPTSREYDDLLSQVVAAALDHDYVSVAQRRREPRDEHRHPWVFVAALVAFGIILGVSALKTERDRPAQLAERAQLIAQIHNRRDRLDGLHAQLTSLQEDVTKTQELLAEAVTSDRQLSDRLAVLAMTAGTVSVTGPGVTITVDDAAGSASGLGGVIRDTDLQRLVTGLWQAGAEAMAINGNRLTSLSSIRFAGRAITVNYRSLSPPYVIDAVGNPDTLAARLLETRAGAMWRDLEANFGIRFDIETSQAMTLPADPHEHLLYAREGGG